jgi:hypothetical protein
MHGGAPQSDKLLPMALEVFIQSAQTVTALITIFAQSVALG